MQWFFKLLRLDEDSLREVRIDNYRRQMLAATSVGSRMTAWRLMSREIQQRSPEQVEKMERERGLR